MALPVPPIPFAVAAVLAAVPLLWIATVGLETLSAAAQGAARATTATAVPTATAAAAPPPTPAPALPKRTITRSAGELAHFKAYDAAIAPALATAVSRSDAGALQAAAKALADNAIDKVTAARATIADPTAAKLIDWLRLRAGYGEPAEVTAFLAANPAWPDRLLMAQRMEEAAFASGGSASAIKALLPAPRTGLGHAAIAAADLATGDTAAAKTRAVKIWREMLVPPQFEVAFLDRFGALLSPADHQWRLDRLMMDDVRWAPDRAERRPVILRQIDRLADDAARKRAVARLAVFDKRDAAAKALMLAALPTAPKSDVGFLYHRVQLLRRTDKIADATRLIAEAPTDPALTPNLDDWWVERRGLAYEALEAANPKLAYDLIKAPGPLSVNPAKEQGFMAGWIALRYLKAPKQARPHFEAALKAADGPLSRAKASYWMGRLAEAEGNAAAATEPYRAAAREIDTFHGQLARLKLDPKDRRIAVRYLPAPTAEQADRFNRLDAVQAAVIAHRAGLDRALVRAFWNHLRIHLEAEPEAAMVSHLAVSLGDVQAGVRNGKIAVARGQWGKLVYGYPVHTFPDFDPLGASTPETAMLLGIARQESEFNTETVSGAGAKGLLQVMTITAKHVCSDYKIKCEIDRLLTDKTYNTRIAAAYVGDRMAEFRGSYVLGIAGYNAGPGRARQWVRAFGDPRDPAIDPIDWIERIPFQETREYVAKVLANIQIYRARLGDEANALQLDKDLVRARETTPAAAANSASR